MSDANWNALGLALVGGAGILIVRWLVLAAFRFIIVCIRGATKVVVAAKPEAMARTTGELVATVKRGYKEGHGE